MRTAFGEIDPHHRFWLSTERAKNQEVTLLLADLSKAFESIQRRKMEQILQAHGQHKETVKKTAIIMLCKNTNAMVPSPDVGAAFFNIVAGAL